MRMSRRIIIVSGILFIFAASALNIGTGAAKTREDMIFTFLNENRTSDGGFKESNTTNSPSSIFASYCSVVTIDKLGRINDIKDKNDVINYMETRFSTPSLDLDNIPDIFYTLKGAKLLNGSIETNNTIAGKELILSLRDNVTYGYRTSGDLVANIFASYLAISYYKENNDLITSITENVSSFVMNCYDDINGGFGGSIGNRSTPADTYYALEILEIVGKTTLLDDTQKAATIAYLDSFYVSDSSLTNHYGGYSYSSISQYSSLLLTYYCVGGLKILGSTLHKTETLNFILSRQSPQDFGFIDYNEQPDNSVSSAILTYYAVETMYKLDVKNFEKAMDTDLWLLEVNPWVLTAIIIGIVGGIVIICVVIWKLKNRI